MRQEHKEQGILSVRVRGGASHAPTARLTSPQVAAPHGKLKKKGKKIVGWSSLKHSYDAAQNPRVAWLTQQNRKTVCLARRANSSTGVNGLKKKKRSTHPHGDIDLETS